MNVTGATIIITGGAQGIGRALATAFKNEGAKQIVLLDIEKNGLEATAQTLVVHGMVVDVTDESAFTACLADIQARFGPVDLLCSNAGIATDGGPELPRT